jgi:hypothetical protein
MSVIRKKYKQRLDIIEKFYPNDNFGIIRDCWLHMLQIMTMTLLLKTDYQINMGEGLLSAVLQIGSQFHGSFN